MRPQAPQRFVPANEARPTQVHKSGITELPLPNWALAQALPLPARSSMVYRGFAAMAGTGDAATAGGRAHVADTIDWARSLAMQP